jgi:hypothetical protein
VSDRRAARVCRGQREARRHHAQGVACRWPPRCSGRRWARRAHHRLRGAAAEAGARLAAGRCAALRPSFHRLEARAQHTRRGRARSPPAAAAGTRGRVAGANLLTTANGGWRGANRAFAYSTERCSRAGAWQGGSLAGRSGGCGRGFRAPRSRLRRCIGQVDHGPRRQQRLLGMARWGSACLGEDDARG